MRKVNKMKLTTWVAGRAKLPCVERGRRQKRRSCRCRSWRSMDGRKRPRGVVWRWSWKGPCWRRPRPCCCSCRWRCAADAPCTRILCPRVGRWARPSRPGPTASCAGSRACSWARAAPTRHSPEWCADTSPGPPTSSQGAFEVKLRGASFAESRTHAASRASTEIWPRTALRNQTETDWLRARAHKRLQKDCKDERISGSKVCTRMHARRGNALEKIYHVTGTFFWRQVDTNSAPPTRQNSGK